MSVRVEVAAGAPAELKTWCSELPSLLDSIPAEAVLHRARNVLFQHELSANHVVAKVFGRTLSSLATDCWRGSKARRSFTIAQQLLERGISTPEPLAWAEWTMGPTIHRSCYVSRAIPDATQLHWWLRSPTGAEAVEANERLHAAGKFIAAAHRVGVIHRDLSPGNLIYGSASGAEPAWQLVDLNRIMFAPINDVAAGASWLGRLLGHQTTNTQALLGGYAAGWDAPTEVVIEAWHASRANWLQRSRLQRRSRHTRRELKRRLGS